MATGLEKNPTISGIITDENLTVNLLFYQGLKSLFNLILSR